MGERWPTEKLQEWGTLTPNTAAFPLPPQGQTPRGNWTQHWPLRTFEMQIVLFTSLPLAQNICSSINEKQPLLFSNFCPCFILPGDGGHAFMSPWHSMGVVVTFENFWLGSPGSWHHCPSPCILSSRMKPGWSGNGYRWKCWSNQEKKLNGSLLQHQHPGFLFQTSQLSQQSHLLSLEYVVEQQLVILP